MVPVPRDVNTNKNSLILYLQACLNAEKGQEETKEMWMSALTKKQELEQEPQPTKVVESKEIPLRLTWDVEIARNAVLSILPIWGIACLVIEINANPGSSYYSGPSHPYLLALAIITAIIALFTICDYYSERSNVKRSRQTRVPS